VAVPSISGVAALAFRTGEQLRCWAGRRRQARQARQSDLCGPGTLAAPVGPIDLVIQLLQQGQQGLTDQEDQAALPPCSATLYATGVPVELFHFW
jgi:hypothetical protein